MAVFGSYQSIASSHKTKNRTDPSPSLPKASLPNNMKVLFNTIAFLAMMSPMAKAESEPERELLLTFDLDKVDGTATYIKQLPVDETTISVDYEYDANDWPNYKLSFDAHIEKVVGGKCKDTSDTSIFVKDKGTPDSGEFTVETNYKHGAIKGSADFYSDNALLNAPNPATEATITYCLVVDYLYNGVIKREHETIVTVTVDLTASCDLCPITIEDTDPDKEDEDVELNVDCKVCDGYLPDEGFFEENDLVCLCIQHEDLEKGSDIHVVGVISASMAQAGDLPDPQHLRHLAEEDRELTEIRRTRCIPRNKICSLLEMFKGCKKFCDLFPDNKHCNDCNDPSCPQWCEDNPNEPGCEETVCPYGEKELNLVGQPILLADNLQGGPYDDYDYNEDLVDVDCQDGVCQVCTRLSNRWFVGQYAFNSLSMSAEVVLSYGPHHRQLRAPVNLDFSESGRALQAGAKTQVMSESVGLGYGCEDLEDDVELNKATKKATTNKMKRAIKNGKKRKSKNGRKKARSNAKKLAKKLAALKKETAVLKGAAGLCG